MANSHANLRNSDTGEEVRVPFGFSWTTFFWGPFPALFRGDWKWAAIIFITAVFTWNFSNFIFAFVYNKLHIKDLLRDGYKVVDVENGSIDLVSDEVGFEKSKITI
jgi:hypothetical protein